jgi:hypothetical protein
LRSHHGGQEFAVLIISLPIANYFSTGTMIPRRMIFWQKMNTMNVAK